MKHLEESNKVFWHEAFFEALQLEFHQYHDALTFDSEYQLSKEALIMDVLVIKKKPGQYIDKNIGRIFRAHNVFEYKSETDSLTQHDYNKVVAYALLYSSFNLVPVSDITVTLRSNLSVDDVTKIADAYAVIKHFEPKNVYLNRLIQANPSTFKEATDMSNAAAELLYKISKEDGGGWVKEMFKRHEMEEIAKKMLLRGDPIEDIAEITELPYETVASLA